MRASHQGAAAIFKRHRELSRGPPLFYIQRDDLVASEKKALIAFVVKSVGGGTAALPAFVKMRMRSHRRGSGRGEITVLSAWKSWQRVSCEIKRWSNKQKKNQQHKKTKPNGDTKKIQSLIRTSVPLMSCFTRTWYFCHSGRLKGRPFLSCYFLPSVCIYTCLPPGASYINRYGVFFINSTIFQRVSSFLWVLVSWSEWSFGGGWGRRVRGLGGAGGRADQPVFFFCCCRRFVFCFYALLSSGFVWMLLSLCTLISIVSGLRDSFPFSSFSGSFLRTAREKKRKKTGCEVVNLSGWGSWQKKKSLDG